MNRKTARENAFILLFERSIKKDETAEEIFEKATSYRELECDEYVKTVFFGVSEEPFPLGINGYAPYGLFLGGNTDVKCRPRKTGGNSFFGWHGILLYSDGRPRL